MIKLIRDISRINRGQNRRMLLNSSLKHTLSIFILLSLLLLTPTDSHAVTAEEFYNHAAAQKWIHPFAATCQSAHETGFWKSPLWQKSFNGAGIKADKAWRQAGRPVIKHVSPESIKGKTVYKTSYFRAYSSLPDFLYDYSVKIYRDYPLAAMNHDTMWGYFAALNHGRKGSWATSGKYFEHMVDKAVRLAPQLLGVQWRMQLLTEYNEAQARGLLSQTESQIVLNRLRTAGILAPQL